LSLSANIARLRIYHHTKGPFLHLHTQNSDMLINIRFLYSKIIIGFRDYHSSENPFFVSLLHDFEATENHSYRLRISEFKGREESKCHEDMGKF
jgi:hypothetical protein